MCFLSIYRRTLLLDKACKQKNMNRKDPYLLFSDRPNMIIDTETPGRGSVIAFRYELNLALVSCRDEERGQFVSSVSAFALRLFFLHGKEK